MPKRLMKTKFAEIKCEDCGNKQIIFIKPSTVVTCLVCGATIAKPIGRTANIRGEIIRFMP